MEGLIIFLILISLGLIVGKWNEKRHIRNLSLREEMTSNILVTQLKCFPTVSAGKQPPQLFIGEVVIATDYLKSFLANIRNLFGGEVKSFQTLQARARREATLRVVEQAKEQGYNAVCNMRFESADVGGNATTRKNAMVAILASGTAYHSE